MKIRPKVHSEEGLVIGKGNEGDANIWGIFFSVAVCYLNGKNGKYYQTMVSICRPLCFHDVSIEWKAIRRIWLKCLHSHLSLAILHEFCLIF